MNNITLTVLTSVVASAIVSTILTFFANLYLKRIDFGDTYRKYILESRQKAYESCYNLISELNQNVVKFDDSGKKIRMHNLFVKVPTDLTYSNSPTYLSSIKLADTLMVHYGWYSHKMTKELVLLQDILILHVNEQYKQTPLTQEYIYSQGYENFSRINEQIIRCYRQYFFDLKRMNKIKSFLNEKTNLLS